MLSNLASDVIQWIKSNRNFQLQMTHITKLFENCIQDQNFKAFNFVFLITRKYVFWYARNKFIPSFLQLKNEIKQRYLEQEYLATLSYQDSGFDCELGIWKKQWLRIKLIKNKSFPSSLYFFVHPPWYNLETKGYCKDGTQADIDFNLYFPLNTNNPQNLNIYDRSGNVRCVVHM